jgi:hypothetical protein
VLFSGTPAYPVDPDPLGTAHKPWKHSPWNLPFISLGVRSLPSGLIDKDLSIAKRIAAVNVTAEPGEAPVKYAPTNLPKS